MRPVLRSWMLLMVAAIVFVGAMFWARANPPAQNQDPLEEAQQQIESAFGMTVEKKAGPQGGLHVESLKPGSPAEQVGLQEGDRIVAVGTKSVWHVHQFVEFTQGALGTTGAAVLMVERDGQYKQTVFARQRQG